jgi:arsenate reductase
MRRYRVLFVCIGNACRSQMAEAFARKHAADVMEPASCGIQPCEMIAPSTREFMLEKGIDLDGCVPKGFAVTGFDYDVIVNMSGFPLPRAARAPTLTWPVEDPYWVGDRRHRQIRDELEMRVKSLADRLRKRAIGFDTPDLREAQ